MYHGENNIHLLELKLNPMQNCGGLAGFMFTLFYHRYKFILMGFTNTYLYNIVQILTQYAQLYSCQTKLMVIIYHYELQLHS